MCQESTEALRLLRKAQRDRDRKIGYAVSNNDVISLAYLELQRGNRGVQLPQAGHYFLEPGRIGNVFGDKFKRAKVIYRIISQLGERAIGPRLTRPRRTKYL